MFKRMSERDFYLGSVDAENGRIISRGENPIIPFFARALKSSILIRFVLTRIVFGGGL